MTLSLVTRFLLAVVLIVPPSAMAQDYGARAMANNMDRLCYLTPETQAFSESSYDRRGLDVDLPAPSLGNPYPTYLGVDEHGDKILLDVKGPGCVYRLFMSEMENRQNSRLKIYFDDSATPAIDAKVSELCQAKVPGFPCPLVHIRNQTGTGAPFTSQNNDVPLPFSRAIRITCNDPGPSLYQNIQYHLFTPGTPVTTWTPDQDLTDALDLVNRLGMDPKPTVGNTVASGTSDLAAGGTATLLDGLQGKRRIQSIKLRLPGYSATAGEPLAATGRDFTGASQFRADVVATNDGVRLSRVYAVKPGMSSQATVSVDGQEVGVWKTAVPNVSATPDNLWRESTFYIPRAFTKGKTSILIKVVNSDPGKTWNESSYSVYSNYTDALFSNPAREESDKKTKAKGYRLTDTILVGDAASVAAHAYACTGQTWSGQITSKFPARSADCLSLLNEIKIRISWDDEAAPSVDARLCEFFCQSEFGLENSEHSTIGRTVPVGLDEDNQLYCYFPMPFQSRAKIELVSSRAAATAGVEYEIQHQEFTDDFSQVGYFKAKAIHETKRANDTTCFTLLDVQGAGKLVGVTDNMLGTAINGAAYLEGDERVYVDGSKTPAISGSGKEDFHGGSYYFYGGPASLPFSGCTYNAKWGYNSVAAASSLPYKCSAYRFLINDSVPFRTRLKLTMEHGSHMNYPGWPGEEKDAPNHDWEQSTYLTFYYLNPAPAMGLTDTLKPSDAVSRAAHQYVTAGKIPIAKSGNWDRNGYYDQATHTHCGMTLAANTESLFNVAIVPSNNGVMLRRLMWYATANQQAEVWVDGLNTGVWYDGGNNPQQESDLKPMLWHETQYFIPQSFTHGKQTLEIKIKVLSPAWNEFKYEVFSLAAGLPPEDADDDGLPDAWEITHSLDPNDNGSGNPANGLAGDPDADGVSNKAEFDAGSDPQSRLSIPADIDADRLTDNLEIKQFGSLTQTGDDDPDHDGYDNLAEQQAGSDPSLASSTPDSDADGLGDGWEVRYFRASPSEAVQQTIAKHDGTSDPDHDGADNAREYLFGTDPSNAASVTPPALPNQSTWHLGEYDPAAVADAALSATTLDLGGKHLTRQGTGGTYSSSVPAAGSTLCASFDGNQNYAGSGSRFFSGLDLRNFELSFDAFPTSAPSYHLAVACGRYGSGACFIYHLAGAWRFGVSGSVVDPIIGAGSVTMNQWQHIRFVRKDGNASLYVNGVLLGTTAAFPTLSDDFSIGAGINTSGLPDGRFIGRIDNVKLGT